MIRLSGWLKPIWQHMLQTNEAMTVRQMEWRFGDMPPCSLTAAQCLDIAIKNGYFKSMSGRRLYACEQVPKSRPKSDSQFTGIKRVSSVWQLGA